MRIQLCYKTKDTAKGKVTCLEFVRIKDAMAMWDNEISEKATNGCLRKWDVWDYKVIRVLKEEVKQ